MISNRAIAKELGVSPSLVGEWRKRGMPNDNMASAREWRAANKVSPEQRSAKIRKALLRRWAEGKYDHLRKPKPTPEEKAARQTLRIERIRIAVIKAHAEGRCPSAQLFTSEARARAGLTLRTSPRAIAARKYALKVRQARARARRIYVSSIFNEGKVSELIVRWQRTGNEELFASIIRECRGLINTTICKYSPTSSSEFAEIRDEVILKLAFLLPKYDPAKGRAFSFFVFSIRNFLISRFDKIVRRRSHEVLTDFTVFEETGAVALEIPLESEEFLGRLSALLHPQGWQWRWQWRKAGKLSITEWRPEWKWTCQGKIAA